MPVEMRKLIKGMQEITREVAEELKIAPELLARKRQILAVLEDYQNGGELVWSGDMAGWRKDLLQEKFTQLVTKTS